MHLNGPTPTHRPDAPPIDARQAAESFLPDFCQSRMVLAVVLISELLAFLFALVRQSDLPFWPDLGRISLFVQWLGLTGAAWLCMARPRLAGLPVAAASAAVFALLMLNTAFFSLLVVEIARTRLGLGFEVLLPTDRLGFVLRNEAICLIVTALLLRYFFVAHQWKRQIRAEARARLAALQARMRPHFLFNSMNTIAALTRSDPTAAETAVEDLADLLRATFKDSDRLVTVDEELALTRAYARIEMLRLGQRLRIDWDVERAPGSAWLPGLTLQPLLENAIRHGIEPLPEGGTIRVGAGVDPDRVMFTITNPVSAEADPRPGNRQALENLRERLTLAYGAQAKVETMRSATQYSVTVTLPLQT